MEFSRLPAAIIRCAKLAIVPFDTMAFCLLRSLAQVPVQRACCARGGLVAHTRLLAPLQRFTKSAFPCEEEARLQTKLGALTQKEAILVERGGRRR